MAAKSPTPTFEVRFVAPGIAPEKIPLRAVSDALTAVQDLASGRDSFETRQVPPDKVIRLLDVRRGSAVYRCVAAAPEEAVQNLTIVGTVLSGSADASDECVAAAIGPIRSLSDVAKSVGCRLEVSAINGRRTPLFVVEHDAYERIAGRLFLKGDTTVVGCIERVGGATDMRCALRVHGRHRMLFCDVESKDLVRRLGQHLYETIAASGSAIWIHRSWRIHHFTIRDFTQPKLGNLSAAINDLRAAGLSAWDEVPDPETFVSELR